MPRWGSLLARQFSPAASFFLASCAASPPPESPPPPVAPVASVEPPAASPSIPLPDPPGASSGLGSLEPIGAREGGVRLSIQQERLVPFGLGVLAVGEIPGRKDGAAPWCLLPPADGAGCSLLRVGRWKTPVTGAAFFREAAAGEIASWSAPVRGPTGWESFRGGARFVYAVSAEEGIVLDRIDEKGQISRLLDGEGPTLRGAQVVETAAGLVVVGAEAGDEGIPELTAVPLTEEGKKLVPGSPQSIKIIPWVEGMLAMNVRPWVKGGRRATVGPWATAPVLSTEGALTDEFFLLWTEATLPPRKGGAMPTKVATPDCGGCGCLSSRLLEDGSVRKRVHLTRRNLGGKVLDDHVLALKPSSRPEDDGIPQSRSPRLVPTPQGVEVNGQGFDLKGKPTGQASAPEDRLVASPPIEGATIQALEGAGFDEGSGQGLVLLSEGEWLGAARFDGLGRRVGELSWSKGASIPPLFGAPVRVGERWVSLDRTKHHLVVLAGADAGKIVTVGKPPEKAPESGFTAVVPWREGRALLVRQTSREDDPETPDALLLSEVNFDTGAASPWEPAKDWFPGEPARPRLREVQAVRAEPDGTLVLTGISGKGKRAGWAELQRRPDGSWGEPAPLLPKDAPAVIVEANRLRPKGCLFRFVTGPRRAVLACNEAVDPEKPSARVGLRVLRLPP